MAAMQPIRPAHVGPLAAPLSPGGAPAQPDAGFKDMLVDSIRKVNSMQTEANKAVENLFTGGESNPAEVLRRTVASNVPPPRS